MVERRLPGRAASPGLAIGPLWRREVAPPAPATERGSPAEEQDRLDAAMATAASALKALAASAADDGAEILAFQAEMLDDPALIEEARADIEAGTGASLAWQRCLDAQIAGFETADDEYFKARGADLEDLKQRVLDLLSGDRKPLPTLHPPDGAIVVADDLTPSRFLATDWRRLGGIALTQGSSQSHVAMLARARGVPMVVDIGDVPNAHAAVLDAERGMLVTQPTPLTLAEYEVRCVEAQRTSIRAADLLGQPAVTRGGERVRCLLNVDDPHNLDRSILAAADGIGLWRTEFLFLHRGRLPQEDEQYLVYRALVDGMGGRPVIIRTLDVGGDKPLPEITVARESNPFLGLRGLRLCLDMPELFRPQVRALLRAAVGRRLKVMLPMVSRAVELEEARSFFYSCLDELRAEDIAATMPPLGIMVETPASAIAIDTFACDFVSIGSNDLVQYTMAASRDAGGRVAALADPLDPAVLRLIERVVHYGSAADLEVSICGDMAGDPIAASRLLDLGLRRLSVGPAALGRLKLAVADYGR